MDLDIENICRVCLGKGSLKPIFITKGTFDGVVSCAEMMKNCATVTISEDDKLPHHICSECLISLKIAYKFRRKCESSYEYLKTFINREDETSIELDPSSFDAKQVNEGLAELFEMKLIEDAECNQQMGPFTGEFCDVKDIKQETKQEEDSCMEPITEINEGGRVTNSKKLKTKTAKRKKKTNRRPNKICINQKKYGYFITRGRDDVDLDPEYLEALYRIYKHRCEHCPRVYAVSTYFTVHVNSHLGIRPYHCEICNKNYPEERSHLKYHRQRDVKGSYKCEMCEKSYNSESSLRSHIKIHTGEVKWHPCSFCPLKYDQLSKLKRHVVVHTREKNIVCKFCQKTFRFDRNLRIHTLTVHSDARPHKCDVCDKGYVTAYDLSVHKQKHLGITNYHCQICSLGFYSSSELRSHVNVVHSKKEVISCLDCGACFVRTYDLNKHIILHHPDRAMEDGLDISQIKLRKITNTRRKNLNASSVSDN